jgi:hypothetical protein
MGYTSAAPGGSHVAFLTGTGSFGAALAIGDFNDDGFADLAVGAPDVMHGSESAGEVDVYLGSPTGLHFATAIPGRYDGDEPYNLGSALASADANGDGYADLAATMPGADDGLQLYLGGPGGVSTSAAQQLWVVPNAISFNDVNRDHHVDLVSADWDSVQVFYGTASGLNETAQVLPESSLGVQYGFGTAVATGDVNGDGYPDAVVGAGYDRYVGVRTSGGTIVVLFGGASGLQAAARQVVHESQVWANWHDDNGFGAALSVARVDSDGYSDVLVGAPTESVSGVRAGAAYLLHGGSSGLHTSSAQRFTQGTAGVAGSAASGARFGAAVYLTRLNGDSSADAIVGAPGATSGASAAGMFVKLYATPTGLTGTGSVPVGDNVADDHLGSAIR